MALDRGRMRAWNFTAEAERRGGKLGVYNFQELNEQRKAWKMTHRRTDSWELKNVRVGGYGHVAGESLGERTVLGVKSMFPLSYANFLKMYRGARNDMQL